MKLYLLRNACLDFYAKLNYERSGTLYALRWSHLIVRCFPFNSLASEYQCNIMIVMQWIFIYFEVVCKFMCIRTQNIKLNARDYLFFLASCAIRFFFKLFLWLYLCYSLCVYYYYLWRLFVAIKYIIFFLELFL